MKKGCLWIPLVFALAATAAAQKSAPTTATRRHAQQRAAAPSKAAVRDAEASDPFAEPEKMPADAQIAAALKDVSSARVRATIEKLVSFHNRNTLGSASPELAAKGQGVVAARE